MASNSVAGASGSSGAQSTGNSSSGTVGATGMAGPSFASHNPRPPELHSLQIRTKSIEQTLIPLVTQVRQQQRGKNAGDYWHGFSTGPRACATANFFTMSKYYMDIVYNTSSVNADSRDDFSSRLSTYFIDTSITRRP